MHEATRHACLHEHSTLRAHLTAHQHAWRPTKLLVRRAFMPQAFSPCMQPQGCRSHAFSAAHCHATTAADGGLKHLCAVPISAPHRTSPAAVPDIHQRRPHTRNCLHLKPTPSSLPARCSSTTCFSCQGHSHGSLSIRNRSVCPASPTPPMTHSTSRTHGPHHSPSHTPQAAASGSLGYGSGGISSSGGGDPGSDPVPLLDIGFPSAWQTPQHPPHPLHPDAAPLQALSQRLSQWVRPLLLWCRLYREILVRAAVTLAMMVVIRAGLFIPLPGLDLHMLPAGALDTLATSSEGAQLAKALYGQASAIPGCIAKLGVSPYVNASMVVAMLLAIPQQLVQGVGAVQKLQEARKEGRSGQAVINSWANNLGLLFAVFWGVVRAREMAPHAVLAGPLWVPLTALALVAGSSITQYCSEVISAFGLGSGSGLIICASVMSDYAQAVLTVCARLQSGAVSAATLCQLLGGYLVLALGTVYIQRTELRLPITQYLSSVQPQPDGDPDPDDSLSHFAEARADAEARITRSITALEYLPLPLNSSGMMSVIMAGVLLFHLLPMAASFLRLTSLSAALINARMTVAGQVAYGAVVFLLEFVPLGGLNPKEAAEYLNAMSVGIKGVVPGEATEEHLRRQMLLCKFWGGLALAVLAVCAQLFDAVCMYTLGASLSATSLLIIVGTVMQSTRQVESLLEGPKLSARLMKEQDLITSLTFL